MPITGRGKSLTGWFGWARRRQGFARLYADAYQESAASTAAWGDWFFDAASGGGGGITGTLAATESGSDAAAIAGDVIVDGTLAATEGGADTAAFAGDVIVLGALAATEAGQDTAAIAGDVLIRGSIAATETGSDTAAIAGGVAIRGLLAATESGSDTAAITGQITATPRPRGDDAFKTSGQRERFWRAKAEEWLEDRLEAVKRAARGPQRARKRLATRIAADVPAFVSEIPDLAPRVDALARLGERLQAPQVDYTAIAQAVAAQMALIEAWNTRQRRRRDMEALLILAA